MRLLENWRVAATRHRPLDTARVLLGVVLTTYVIVHLVNLLRRYYVDVLYMDGWEMVPLVEKTYDGSASFGDFWAQANEHRPVFPRLILTLLAHITHWDTRAEVALNLCLGLAMTLTTVFYFRQNRHVLGRVPFWAIPLTTLFIFGPSQWENWLWGWEFLIFLQVACGVVGMFFLTMAVPGWSAFVVALILGFVGSFSFGNGLMYWFAGIPIILLDAKPLRFRRLAIWIVVAAVTVGVYMYGWQPNPGHPPAARNFENLTTFWFLLTYFAVFVGAPVWSSSAFGALIAGLAGLTLCLWLIVVVVKRPLLRPLLLWPLGLMLQVIAAGALTAIGRAGFGVVQAMASRYQTISMPFWIGAVLFLAVLLHIGREKRFGLSRVVPVFQYGIVTAIAISAVMSANASETHWRRWNLELAPAREALRTNGDGALQTRLYPNPFLIAERRVILERRKLQVFRPAALSRLAP